MESMLVGGHSPATNVLDADDSSREHHPSRRDYAMAAELRRCFPERALDDPASASWREVRRIRCDVVFAAALVPADSRFGTRAAVLLAASPQLSTEQDAAERRADRGAHTRCRPAGSGYRLRQSGHRGAAEAGRSACQVRRGVRDSVERRSKRAQEPLPRCQWQRQDGAQDRPRSSGTGMEDGGARGSAVADRAAHRRSASAAAACPSHHACPAAASQDHCLRARVAGSDSLEHAHRGPAIAPQLQDRRSAARTASTHLEHVRRQRGRRHLER